MNQRGQAGIILVGVLVVLVLALVGLFAVCTPGEDDHSLGRHQAVVQVAYHGEDCEYDDCGDGGSDYNRGYNDEGRHENSRRRNRGAFSPGPFQDSPVTICLPYSCNSGGEQSGGNRNDGRGRDDQPPPDEGSEA